MTRRTITAWLLVHKWASLVCTAFLLMLCVTGLPLIFHAEIDDWLDPPAPLAAVPVGTRPPSLDTLLARAVAGHAGDVPLYLSFDEDRPVVNVTTGPAPDAPAAAMRFQSLDARTGAVLPPRGVGVMAFVLRLHTDLLLGRWAEWLLGAMALVFVAAIGSGIVLYAPFMARLGFGTIRGEKGERVRRLDRHNLLGIATAAWAVVVGLTGAINTLVDPVTEMWKADQLAAIARTGPVVTGRLAPLQPAVEAAMRAAPGMRVQFVAFPGVAYSTHRHYGIFLQGTTPLTRRLLTPAFVDAATGRLDAVRPMPWYMKALLLAQPLHFGDYAGLPMKLIWAVLDILTIAVLVGGLRLWVDRRRT
ncbi:MAG: PepSY-associated TM helix domain-containing protein, partial [Janthinobacterium lividum]